jgi:hypothetical protein
VVLRSNTNVRRIGAALNSSPRVCSPPDEGKRSSQSIQTKGAVLAWNTVIGRWRVEDSARIYPEMNTSLDGTNQLTSHWPPHTGLLSMSLQ